VSCQLKDRAGGAEAERRGVPLAVANFQALIAVIRRYRNLTNVYWFGHGAARELQFGGAVFRAVDIPSLGSVDLSPHLSAGATITFLACNAGQSPDLMRGIASAVRVPQSGFHHGRSLGAQLQGATTSSRHHPPRSPRGLVAIADHQRDAGVTSRSKQLESALVVPVAGSKTPIVGPHGLRGTHATLAVEAGVTGDVVAAALGHESFAVTAGHYASAESVTSARTRKVEAALSCGTPGEFRRSSAGGTG
jgi:hypothetical protein